MTPDDLEPRRIVIPADRPRFRARRPPAEQAPRPAGGEDDGVDVGPLGPVPETYVTTSGRLLAAAAVVVAVVGVIRPRPVAAGLAPVDPALFGIIAVAAAVWMREATPARRLLGRSALWLWLILAGSLLALVGVGLPGWALRTLLADAFSFLLLFAVVEIAVRYRVPAWVGQWSALAGLALVAAWVLATSSVRPAGPFDNPNYAGHYLALAAVFLLTTRFGPVVVRLLVLLLTAVAVVKTASFGAALMLAAGVVLVVWRYGRSRPGRAAAVAGLVLAVLLGLAATGALEGIDPAAVDPAQSAVFGADRLDKSGLTRAGIWEAALAQLPEHPLGVGPFGLRSRGLLEGLSPADRPEVHSDPIAYLVERGLLGFLGLVGLVVAWFRAFPARGAARAVLVVGVIGSLVRETLHFRHLFVFLALALAYDLAIGARRRRPSGADRPDTDDHPGGRRWERRNPPAVSAAATGRGPA